jgi:hypothetical protein
MEEEKSLFMEGIGGVAYLLNLRGFLTNCVRNDNKNTKTEEIPRAKTLGITKLFVFSFWGKVGKGAKP